MLRFFEVKEQFSGLMPNQYVTTTANFNDICKLIEQSGVDPNSIIHLLQSDPIEQHDTSPVCISFRESLGEAFAPLLDKEHIRIAVMNAFGGTALGDNLIGINAFNLYRSILSERFPDKTFEFNLFQIAPEQITHITSQCRCENVAPLPTPISAFIYHDAFIDLSGMMDHELFQSLPIFDFFLSALSISDDIPDEWKRLNFETDPACDHVAEMLFRHIRKRAGKKPVVLLHPLASGAIRSMPNSYALRLIEDLTRAGYFVLSCVGLITENDQHMDVATFSKSFLDFVSIVKCADSIITVDTITAHLSDVFSTKAVVIFSTIDPDLRIRYYPHAVGIKLDCPRVAGLHKIADEDSDEGREIFQDVIDSWKKLPTATVRKVLPR